MKRSKFTEQQIVRLMIRHRIFYLGNWQTNGIKLAELGTFKKHHSHRKK